MCKGGNISDYNLGVILSRTLSYVVAHNDYKPLYAGAIATMIYEHIETERKFKNKETKILESNLFDSTLLLKMGVIRMWNNDIVTYRFMVRHGTFECTVSLILNILTGYQTYGLLWWNSLNGKTVLQHQ
jgi:hypothetical protein